MKEIQIGNNEKDKRLDGFLKTYLPNASMGFIYKMLSQKNITLNGKKADGTERLKSGDLIRIFFADETFEKFRGVNSNSEKRAANEFTALKKFGDIQIIYENDHIILFNKPAGVLSQKAKPEDISLNDYLIEYLLKKGEISEKELETYKPSICNRLDRNTSGLVICAKSLLGARIMNEMLKDRSLDKYYRTIVKGRISKASYLKGYLYKDESRNKVFIKKENPHDDRYSFIETGYEPIAYNEKRDLTLLEVKLVTGKPHQIRAHLSSQNTPIIGDVKYNGPKIDGLNMQILHSYRLKFPDSFSSDLSDIEGKEFVAPLPDIFEKYFKI